FTYKCNTFEVSLAATRCGAPSSSRKPDWWPLGCWLRTGLDRSALAPALGEFLPNQPVELRQCAAADATVTQRFAVLLGEALPRVRDRQDAGQYHGERGLLRGDAPVTVAGPAVRGLPSNQLRCGGFSEPL